MTTNITTFDIPDVDLDVSDRAKALESIGKFIPASQVVNGKLVPHNTGIYLQDIPKDPVTNLSSFEYKLAESLGYFKVDVITNRVYDLIHSNEELEEFLRTPVDWSWFQDERFFQNEDTRYQLTHIASHKYICEMYPPSSIEDLACLIAMIRPRKKYLIGESWDAVKKVIWLKLDEEKDEYFFKKSHAIAYAHLVVVHAHVINRKLNQSDVDDTGEEWFI